MDDNPYRSPESGTDAKASGRRFVGAVLWAIAAPIALLSVLMAVAGIRWLVLELWNGWPISLSAALLLGAAVSLGVSCALVWGGRRLRR